MPVEVTIAAGIERYKKERFSFAAMAAASPDEVLASSGHGLNPHFTPPVPINMDQVDVDYSYFGRQNHIAGSCIVAFWVGTDGVPHNVHVVKGLELGMDESAVDAARRLRFKPGIKDGKIPVPFEVLMPFNFKLRVPKRRIIEDIFTAAVFLLA